MTHLSGNTLVLPKETPIEIQTLLDEHPEVKDLFQAASKISKVEFKFLLNKLGVYNDQTYLTFTEFVEYIIRPYHPEMSQLHELHEDWIRTLEEEYPDRNVVCFAPVDSWKSTIFGVLYPLYLIYKTRGNVRMGVFSAAENLAKDRVVQCKEVIELNPRLHELGIRKPDNPSDWGENSFRLDRTEVLSGSTMRAFGIEGQCQGFKFDLMIFDDVVNQKNSTTELKRKTIRTKFLREIITRLVEVPISPLIAARAVTVCTAYHKDDLNHEMTKGFYGGTPMFIEKRYKALYMEDDPELFKAPLFIKEQIAKRKHLIKNRDTGEIKAIGLAFSEHLDYQKLMIKKKKFGDRFFSQNYLQIPLSDEDQLIREEWIRNCFAPNQKMGPDLWFDIYKPRGFKLFFVVDPAIVDSQKKARKLDTDFWVIEARAYSAALDLRVILDQRRGRGNRKKEVLDILQQFYHSFVDPPGDARKIISGQIPTFLPVIYAENNQGQNYLIQDMEDIFGKSHVKRLNTTWISKHDGFVGISAVSYAFEQGLVIIPTGDKRSLEYAENLLDELVYFGFSRHDDCAMVQLLNEQGIKDTRSYIKPLDPALLNMSGRSARNMPKIATPRERARYRQRGGMLSRRAR